jgi:hypothetical protein
MGFTPGSGPGYPWESKHPKAKVERTDYNPGDRMSLPETFFGNFVTIHSLAQLIAKKSSRSLTAGQQLPPVSPVENQCPGLNR